MIYKKYKSLIRLILVYCFTLLLPIVSGAYIISRIYEANIKSEFLSSNHSRILEIEQNMNNLMLDINRLLIYINGDENLFTYKLRRNEYYAYKAQGQLRMYRLGNSALLEIVYYDPKTGLLFSSRTSHSPKSFFDLYYGDSDIDREHFWDMVDNSSHASISKPKFSSTSESGNILTYVFNLPSSDSSISQKPKILFLVDTEVIRSQLKASLPTENSFIVITDSDGNLCVSSREIQPDILTQLDDVFESGPQIREIKISNIPYLFTCSTANEMNWRYCLLTPASDAVTVYVVIWSFICFVLVIIFASILFFLFNFKYHYTPLHKLSILASHHAMPGELPSDEFEIVSRAMLELSGSNLVMKEEIVNNYETRINLLFIQLLLGRTLKSRQLEEIRAALGNKHHFCAVIIYTYCGREVDLASVRELLLANLQGGCCVDEVISDAIVILIGSDENDSVLSGNVRLALDKLTSSYGFYSIAFVGRQYDDIGNVSRSYMEACYIALRRSTPDTNMVLCYDDVIDGGDAKNVYPVRAIQSLREGFASNDIKKISGSMEKIIQFVEMNKIGISYIQFLCYDLIYSYLNYLRENNLDDGFSRKMMEDIQKIGHWDSPLPFLAYIREMDSEFQEHFGKESLSIERKAIEYMNAHFMDLDFSVQNMADSMQVSAGHLSRQFKKTTDTTFMEYINNLRIEKAKSLLAESDTPISEIVQKIGYYDVSSFYRKFKTIVGQTPGDFRKAMQK